MNLASHKLELAQRLLATHDKNLLRAIDMLFTQEDEKFELNDAQKKEIDRRLQKIESGKAQLYSWEEVKKTFGKKLKK